MKTTSDKFNRSGFFHSLDLAWPTNHLRRARMDFWGAVVLVCALGLIARFAQSLLTQ